VELLVVEFPVDEAWPVDGCEAEPFWDPVLFWPAVSGCTLRAEPAIVSASGTEGVAGVVGVDGVAVPEVVVLPFPLSPLLPAGLVELAWFPAFPATAGAVASYAVACELLDAMALVVCVVEFSVAVGAPVSLFGPSWVGGVARPGKNETA